MKTILVVSSYPKFDMFARGLTGVYNQLHCRVTVGDELEFIHVPVSDTRRAISLNAHGVSFIDDSTWADLNTRQVGELMRRVRL